MQFSDLISVAYGCFYCTKKKITCKVLMVHYNYMNTFCLTSQGPASEALSLMLNKSCSALFQYAHILIFINSRIIYGARYLS